MARVAVGLIAAAAVLVMPAVVAAHVASRISDSPAVGWCRAPGWGPGWYRCD